MKWMVGAMAPMLGVTLIDRLALAAEQRGWICWRRRSPTTGAVGNALLEWHALFEPDKQHVVEEVRRMEADIDVNEDDQPLDDLLDAGSAIQAVQGEHCGGCPLASPSTVGVRIRPRGRRHCSVRCVPSR